MHIGKLIKQKLAEQGKTTLWLAQELKYNRTSMYKIYDKASINADTLLQISRIMKYDFFKDLSQELETALPSPSDCR